jgi:hypothetical protein
VPTTEEVAGILGCLRVIGDEKAELLELARNAHEPNWLESSQPGMPSTVTCLVECERTATEIFDWNPALVSGPLQTPEYARAIFTGGSLPRAEIELLLMIRMSRGEVLTRRDAPRYTAVVGETALRQGIGGPEVMVRQLQHLADLAKRRSFSFRVLPSGIGWHPGLLGPFILYDFENLPSIVFVEHFRLSAALYDEGYVVGYGTAATTLGNLAMGEQESLALIAEVIGELEAKS